MGEMERSGLSRAARERRRVSVMSKRILDQLDAEDEGGLSAHQWHKLVVYLTALRNHLRGLILCDKQGGYLSDVLERTPEETLKVRGLEERHRPMLYEIEFLIAEMERVELGYGESDAAQRKQPLSAIRRVLDLIRDYEETKAGLVQESYLRDVGAKD